MIIIKGERGDEEVHYDVWEDLAHVAGGSRRPSSLWYVWLYLYDGGY